MIDSASTRIRAAGAVAALSLLLAHCSALPTRDLFTVDDLAGAKIVGMQDIRYWADQSTPDLHMAYQRRLMQERLAGGPAAITRPAYMLALSGGADEGAFGAGLLHGWTERGNRPQFNLVTGVSTGALIAPLAFLGSSHDPALRKAFTEIEASDIFEQHAIAGLLFGDALTSSDPLRNLVASFADTALIDAVALEHRKGRRLLVATTNLDTQRPVMWDLGMIAASDNPNRHQLFRDVIVASAAVPGLFPPVLIETEANGKRIKELHVDGGVTMNVLGLPRDFALQAAAQRANVKRKTTMYVIYNGRVDPDFSVVAPGTLSIAKRSMSTLLKSHGRSTVFEMYEYTRKNKIDFNLASIGKDFKEVSPAPFNRTYMNKLFDYGFAAGRTGYPWLKAPSGDGL